MASENIIIRGAREHNLKNIDLDLPKNKLIVITGLSGSGKSTLAFDTLYAEGQRRYVESLSTYARQFLKRMAKPDVDIIEGLSPAIAIEQKKTSHNPRSTVGTVTEIYDYLRLLFARIGIPHCYKCKRPITSLSVDEIVKRIMAFPPKTKLIILSPVVINQKGGFKKLFAKIRKEGFSRIRLDGEDIEIENIKKTDKNKKHSISIIIDRLIIKPGIEKRLADSIELGLSMSDGLVMADTFDGHRVLFSEKAACVKCNISYPEFTPACFSFNSPQGACPKCDGLGTMYEIDPELIISDDELSLREGAVSIWADRNSMHFIEFIESLTNCYGCDIFTPYKDLPEDFKKVLFYGSKDDKIPFYFESKGRRHKYEKSFEGIIPKLMRIYKEKGSDRDKIKEYMRYRPCPFCGGTRLNKIAASVKIAGMGISEITSLSIYESIIFFKSLSGKLNKKDLAIGKIILKEISDRLGFLKNAGLGYLTLDRAANSLSGGESQRIRLATQIGSKLTGVLYVLDEPSIGLHQCDNEKLLDILKKMRDLGNTVLIVEHDENIILNSDHVVDMGPKAGINGGEVIFSGAPDRLLKDEKSLTGQYFSGKKAIELPEKRRPYNGPCLVIQKASKNNLKNIDAKFPLGCFTCVTGVSGSGKSTLVIQTLYKMASQRLHHARIKGRSGANNICGFEHIDNVINIDQSPIGKTPRSNPGTYTGIFTHIREVFSKTRDAKIRGYRPGRFSFNIKGGRCEACKGDGIIKIEMHFLPDVYVSCDVCQGKRYNRETLEIRYKGKNIEEVLNMTVSQAYDFFVNIGHIRDKLQTLKDVGLEYIKIGQPATTLSGGEAQRVKLAKELGKRSAGRTLYILDEPTTGLHADDIRKLLNVLNRLVDMGNTVIVIEHNLDVIKMADYVIDLGPEGGDKGGYIIACGSPEEIAANEFSKTGKFLRKILMSSKLNIKEE